jgi:hypothetical protein
VFVGSGGRVLAPLRGTRERRAGEQRPIWRGTDLGQPATVVLDLALSGRMVLAATNSGVFISRDAGETFQPWSEGLPDGPILRVAVAHAERIVFGVGLGGTIWRRRC